MVLDDAAICGRKTVQFCTESSDRLRKIAVTLIGVTERYRLWLSCPRSCLTMSSAAGMLAKNAVSSSIGMRLKP